MRGFPPIQIIIVLVAFILLAIPLWKLTYKGDDVETGMSMEEQSLPVVSAEEEVEIELTIRCAHAPKKLIIMDMNGERASFYDEKNWPQRVSFSLKKKRLIELAVEAEWGTDVESTAVTIELSPEGGTTVNETRWSMGKMMNDVFTFEWL